MDNLLFTSEMGRELQFKKLYWAERPEIDYFFDADLLKSYAEDYSWGYIGDHNVGGSGLVKSLLEVMTEKDVSGYMREYTEEELFDEVANDWGDLRDYLFASDPELLAKITPENLKNAHKKARAGEAETLCELMSLLLGEQVYAAETRGFSQGDYAMCYITLDEFDGMDDEDEREETVRYITAVLEAYLWGKYSVLELVNEEAEEMARAIVLAYTPNSMLGKSYDAKKQATEHQFLLEVGLGDYEGKIGTAMAKKYTAYKWSYEEPKEPKE